MSYYSQPTEPSQIPSPSFAVQEEFQRRQDEDNLRLLSIFHYVMGGITMLTACIFLFHFGMGLMMLLDPASLTNGRGNDGPPVFMGWLFTLFGGGAVLFGWAVGLLTIHAGRCLTRHTGYNLAFVLACLNCLNAPMGTALGIFTIIVLTRPSVKALFGLPVGNPGQPPAPSISPEPSGQPWYRGQ